MDSRGLMGYGTVVESIARSDIGIFEDSKCDMSFVRSGLSLISSVVQLRIILYSISFETYGSIFLLKTLVSSSHFHYSQGNYKYLLWGGVRIAWYCLFFWDDLHGTLLQSHSCHKGDVNALAAAQVISRCFLACSIAVQEDVQCSVIRRRESVEVKNLLILATTSGLIWQFPCLFQIGDDTKLFAYSAQEFTKFAPRDICPAPQRLPIQLTFGELYMWGRDEGDGRLRLGAGRGPNEGGGLSIPSKVNALHRISLYCFLWWVFHNGNHEKMESFGIGEVLDRLAKRTPYGLSHRMDCESFDIYTKLNGFCFKIFEGFLECAVEFVEKNSTKWTTHTQ
ncbi:hypothetical protein Syun_003637 [Stephania yunnanensis]|uniref:Uncharacterized protein n=1 Tax=Stephania yunnanensis TaxID=152371 RepID=A0AAP0L441_9MAGN